VRHHCNDFSIIEILLQRNPTYDINTRSSSGGTLLLQYGVCIENVTKILQLGGDPNLSDIYGRTPLGRIQDTQSFWKLLEHGADPFIYKTAESSVMATITGYCVDICYDITHDWLNLLTYILRINFK
jgi:hypothetical protein